MIAEETTVKKITPQDGYLLTNGETITDTIFIGAFNSTDNGGEIPYIEGGENISDEVLEQVKEDNFSTLKERIDKLENIINSINNPYSVDKEDFPKGDYMNPIQLLEGGLITEKNKWYYVDDKKFPHRAIIEFFATPKNFDDKTGFYFN